jgi:hypothetical protein
MVGVLQQLHDDVLDVLADVARLGQRGRVRDCERHVEDLGQGLGEQSLAAAGRAEQQDVRLAQLDVFRADPGLDALVVIVNRDRERLLRAVLADHVLVQDGLNLRRLGNRTTR